ncbi:uncharacterized protein UTRI_02287 [Ustilago trichophora]|uniref:Fungal lipase-type domain-containing protein n=1 Tax=Ustilago trichophora TaxID=86804 RepID=A0A5C3E5P4_9BASI|nr:uncharacterized protein UTRI_02287 [Ustilago trichophora]
MMPPSTDVRKRPSTNSQPLIGPPHGQKHAELCEHLRKKQVADLAQVSEHGTGILGCLPSFLLDPVGLASALIFAVGTTVMLFFSLIVSAVWRLPIVQNYWRPISAKKNIGLGNLAYPLIFEFGASPQNKLIRDAAFTVMSDPVGYYARPSTAEARSFDLEVSKILMMLSALVYERDVAGKDAYKKLGTADRKINQVANDWGLNYASVSELATNTSPLCGAFWHPDYNFLSSLQGTDPVEFKEWAIDFTFDYTDGRGWLPGFTKVHAGFYNQIFPQKLNHATGAFLIPRSALLSARLSADPYDLVQDHVNLYVTGHSLGAALASVFYSRAIASPKDFGLNEEGGQQVFVRDAYCFGTPILGDPDCISAFNQAVHERDLDHPQALWRSQTAVTLSPRYSSQHYSHLERGGEGPEVTLPPIFWLLERLPIIRRVVAHMPSSYWDRLTKVHAENDIEYVRWH